MIIKTAAIVPFLLYFLVWLCEATIPMLVLYQYDMVVMDSKQQLGEFGFLQNRFVIIILGKWEMQLSKCTQRVLRKQK